VDDGLAVPSLADRLPAATDSVVDGLTKGVGMATERWQEEEAEEEGGGGNSGGGNRLAELRVSSIAEGCLFMGCHSNGTAARLERSSPELLLVLLVLPTLPRLSLSL